MKRDVIKKGVIVLLFLLMGVGTTQGLAWAGATGVHYRPVKTESTGGSPIRIWQKYFSRADGNRCPMYPSCSHYAEQAFAKEGWIKGWILSCDRLLRGGRDETRLAPKIRVNGVRLTYDPLSANIFWWDKKK